MADVTLQELFGNNVNFDDKNKQITFDLDDISSDVFTVNNINSNNIDTYASKILWALLDHLCSTQPEDNNDETRGIYILHQGKRHAIRNRVSQFSFGLTVNAYTPDPMGVKLAPNDLV